MTVVNVSSFTNWFGKAESKNETFNLSKFSPPILVFTLWFCSQHSIRVLCLHHFSIQTLCYNTFDKNCSFFFSPSINCASKRKSLKVVLRLLLLGRAQNGNISVSSLLEGRIQAGVLCPKRWKRLLLRDVGAQGENVLWMLDRKPGLNPTP